MGVIIFNDISSRDYDIQVEKLPDYETPEKDYDIIHVPGRNGDVIIDKGSYKNTRRRYQLSVGSLTKDFVSMANAISEWLHSASGYARLEDSYEPEYYRMAMYKDSGLIENLLGSAGRTSIAFNCKPQRFLKSGDESTVFSEAGTIFNPTGFKSFPTIIINGNGAGVLRIGIYTVSVSSIDTSVTINSDIQDAYNGMENRNSTITLNNGFPKLVPGENNISFSGGITSVEVIPKWWTL
jgi:phage-related protein